MRSDWSFSFQPTSAEVVAASDMLICILDWIHEIYSSEDTSTLETCVGRRKTDNDSNCVQAWWHLAGGMVEHVQNMSTRSKTAMGYSKTRDRRCTLIERNLLDDDDFDTVYNQSARRKCKTHMESAMPCEAQKKTSKIRHCRILCQPAAGNLVHMHSWRKPHAPKKKKKT